MITIEIKKRNDTYQLTATGHAGYAREGSDIVCAGVSALIWTLGNYITTNDRLENAIYEDAEDIVLIRCRGNSNIIYETIKAIEEGLREIGERYPENIKIVDL